MKRKWLLILGGVVLLALVIGASLRGAGGRDAVRVYAEPVVKRSLTQSVKASGQIHPRVKVNISAHVIGKIEKLFVRRRRPDRAPASRSWSSSASRSSPCATTRARDSRWRRPSSSRPRWRSPTRR